MIKVDEYGAHWMQVITDNGAEWRRVDHYEQNDDLGFSQMRPVPSVASNEMILYVIGGPPVITAM